jgi:C1A family cysteine protease
VISANKAQAFAYKTRHELAQDHHSDLRQTFVKFRMKILIIFAIATISIAFASDEIEFTKEQEEKIVNDYFNRFNIRAGRGKSGEEMKKNILKRAKDVEKHNKLENKNFEVDLNEFSYLSDEEFVSTRLGFNPPDDLDEKTDNLTEYFTRGARASIPDFWNWAQVGSVVQPVQDQSSCGSCYAFGKI